MSIFYGLRSLFIRPMWRQMRRPHCARSICDETRIFLKGGLCLEPGNKQDNDDGGKYVGLLSNCAHDDLMNQTVDFLIDGDKGYKYIAEN